MEIRNKNKASVKNDLNNIDNINLIELTKNKDIEFVNLKILVKSKYILKIILSFLDDKKKLPYFIKLSILQGYPDMDCLFFYYNSEVMIIWFFLLFLIIYINK